MLHTIDNIDLTKQGMFGYALLNIWHIELKVIWGFMVSFYSSIFPHINTEGPFYCVIEVCSIKTLAYIRVDLPLRVLLCVVMFNMVTYKPITHVFGAHNLSIISWGMDNICEIILN